MSRKSVAEMKLDALAALADYLLAFALLLLLIGAIVNQITYGDWTCAFKECIVVKGDEE